MLRYLSIRVLLWVPSVLLVLLTVYALAFYGTGDPIKLMFMRQPGDVVFSPERVDAIRESAGLNRPFIEQFISYVGNILQGNFGNSLVSGRAVWSMIKAAAPVSFQLGITAVAITALVAVPLGVFAGLNRNTRIDCLILGSALFLWAIPAYVAGPMLMVALLLTFPHADIPYGWGGLWDVRVIMPLMVLSLQPIALIVRQTRSAVIEIMDEDFVRTARAKGVKEIWITIRHIMRPTLTPVITQLGLMLISLINGAVFVELVFGLPGLGRLTIQSLQDSDYPVILAVTLIASGLVMAANLLVDLIYPLLDPRATVGGDK